MHFLDSIFIFGLMLVLFGPKKLPEIARQAGKLMMEFRRASSDFKMQMEDELRAAEQADRQKTIDAETRAAIALTAATTVTTASLPSGQTVQIAADGTTEALTSQAEDEPRILPPPQILPPSIGEPVSTAPPDFSRTEAESSPEPGAHAPAPAEEQAAGREAAEEFYAQREAELYPALQGEAFAPATASQAQSDDTAIATLAPEKLPGTEMYPDTAPMAESEQAPTHHD